MYGGSVYRRRRVMRLARTVVPATVLCLALSLGGGVHHPAVSSGAVTFLAADSTMGYVQELSTGFADGAAAVSGVTNSERGSAVGDTTSQLAVARDLSNHPRIGVTVFTWNPELLAGPLATAREVGTPVIAVHTPPAPASGIKLFVGNDDYQLGETLAAQLATMIPPGMRGSVILGSSVPGAAALDERTAGVRSWLTRTRPRLRLLGPFDTKQEPASSRDAWKTLVRANPEAVAFVGTGDTDAATLAEVRVATGGAWLAGGFGLDEAALSAVSAGRFALVSPELYLMGAVAGRLQATAVKGYPLPQGWLVTPGLTIRPADVRRIRVRQSSNRLRLLADEDEITDLAVNYQAHLRPLNDVTGSAS
jgi:ribose transport system substrate-binding protein